MNLEDYNEYYIQGSDHYLIPKDVFKELFNEMVNWKEESQKKKEASEKARKEAIELLEKHLEAKSYGNHKYELFSREYLEELLKILYVDKGE